MKPILLVIAGIAVLIMAIYFYNRKANRQLQPVSQKANGTRVIMKDAYSVLTNEARVYESIY